MVKYDSLLELSFQTKFTTVAAAAVAIIFEGAEGGEVGAEGVVAPITAVGEDVPAILVAETRYW